MPSSGASVSPLGDLGDLPTDDSRGAHHIVGRSSVFVATYNLVKVMVGVGVISAPSALVDAGMVAGIVLLALTALMIFFSCKLIMEMASRFNTSTYRDTSTAAWCKWSGYSESIMTFLLTYGSMIAYTVTIGDFLAPAMAHLTGWEIPCLEGRETCKSTVGLSTARILLDRKILITIASLILILPLVLLRDVHLLRHSSAFGLTAFAFIFICTAERAYALPDSEKGSLKGADLYTILKYKGAPSAAARGAFMAICQHAQFMVFNSLKNNTEKNKLRVSGYGITISTIIGILFALLLYIPLNDKLKGNVINTFEGSDIWISICRALLAVHIICTYPLQGHVCRDGLIEAVHGVKKRASTKYRLAYGVAIFVMSFIPGIYFCNVDLVIDLTGGVASGHLSFLLPAILYIHLLWGDRSGKVLKYISPSIIGLFGVWLISSTLVGFINNLSSDTPACQYSYI